MEIRVKNIDKRNVRALMGGLFELYRFMQAKSDCYISYSRRGNGLSFSFLLNMRLISSLVVQQQVSPVRERE